MTSDPADGLKMRQPKRDDEFRAPFTLEELNKLFCGPEYLHDEHKTSYRFWLPILRLLTGTRLNELCQLYVSDIYQVDDGTNPSKWFADYRKRCGITSTSPKKDFHAFRSTVANRLKQAGVDFTIIQELLGHVVQSISLSRSADPYYPKVLFDSSSTVCAKRFSDIK